jgi:hypothetical protein
LLVLDFRADPYFSREKNRFDLPDFSHFARIGTVCL